MNKQKILLIVEDEISLNTLVSDQLKELGYRVYQAIDGEEGFVMARDIKPDLVISDIYMPKKDGRQFLNDLRATDFGKEIPFIAITARVELKEHFKDRRNVTFVGKPFKLKDLTIEIERILEGMESEEASRAGH